MTSPTGSSAKASKQPAVSSVECGVSNGFVLATRHPSLATVRGLTLIEVLISVILLASGAVLVMQSFATGWEVIARADDRSTAYLFAMSKLADLELMNRQGRDLTDRVDGNFRAGAKSFTWHLDVLTDNSREQSPKQVTLSVHWPRGGDKDEAQFSLLLPTLAQEKKEGA